MANPYTSVTLQGYNADAPPDDGTRVVSNQLSWSKHKTKIGDPLKVMAEAMNANLVAAFAKSFGANFTAIATNYSIVTADQGKFLTVTGERTLTLPPVATAGAIFTITVLNLGASVVTVDGDGGELVNGVASIYLGPGESAILSCDSAAWTAMISHAFPSRIQSKAGDYTLLVADTGNWLEFTAKATLTLLAVATAGPAFRIGIINNGGAGVTVTPAGAETINNAASIVLFPGEQALLASDGSEWYALVSRASAQKVKTADESVAGATYQADNHLAGFQLAANSYYEIEGCLELDGDLGNANISIVYSNTPQEQNTAILSLNGATVALFSNFAYTQGVGTPSIVLLRGFVFTHATVGGTAELQWSQSGAGGPGLTIGRGSWLRFTPIHV